MNFCRKTSWKHHWHASVRASGFIALKKLVAPVKTWFESECIVVDLHLIRTSELAKNQEEMTPKLIIVTTSLLEFSHRAFLFTMCVFQRCDNLDLKLEHTAIIGVPAHSSVLPTNLSSWASPNLNGEARRPSQPKRRVWGVPSNGGPHCWRRGYQSAFMTGLRQTAAFPDPFMMGLAVRIFVNVLCRVSIPRKKKS